jgi:toxin ParE1/3/4
MDIRFTRTARSQFNKALRFIARDNPSAAKNFRTKASKTLERVLEYPESGRALPEFSNIPYQEIIVAPYRFFYRIEENTIMIVGVWHSAELPAEPR